MSNKFSKQVRVVVFPKNENPYLQLLYSHMNGVKASYFHNIRLPRIIDMFLTPFELFYFRISGYKVLHLHWTFPFCFSNRNTILLSLSEVYLNIFLVSLKLLNFKLVLTIHDLMPHERNFIDDAKISKKLNKLADAIIVLNNDSEVKLINDFHIPAEKIKKISMGNFVGYYPRKSKKIKKKSGIHLLFFGQIKPYKGIDNLIDVLKLLSMENVYLEIIGKSHDDSYLSHLKKLIGHDDRISLHNSFVENNDVSKLFNHSDLLVLPFQEITNTSTAMLAFSLKVPIIAPSIGMIKDFPKDTGFYYDQQDKNGLRNAIVLASKSRKVLKEKGFHGYRYAKSQSWKTISEQTRGVYLSLIK